MKQKIISLIALGILTACNPSSQNKSSGENSDLSLNTDAKTTELRGKWLQPIPGQEKEKQGFELHDNGVASSLNMHTLLYDQWRVSHDTLYLWYHTEGVQNMSNDIDTLLIKKLDNNQLTVTSLIGNSGMEQTYNKEK
ncbi:lipocalin-like domain-containing protein [Chryseobacterium jejuense]|uniref:Lipocalin-like n=1 Tax=Chryseobacterium jejuense TaxID=445960 RepID=A0A2X2VPT1_CHRJE|nr:lipocalin family protein [Chryseobacterium jejuense]SDI84434.1 Lipocalin-like [Chryseobacterium jejuense]SQB27641.1 Lipocalin-like [Chryseobacterium jejuense]